MAEQHKYMFETDFTPGVKRLRDEVDLHAEAVPVEAPLPPAVMFSEEELSLARDSAFEEGRAIGFNEGKEAGGTQVAMALESILQSLPAISQAQTQCNEQILADAVKLTLAAIRRALPAMSAKYAFDEVAKVVADLIPHLLDEPRLIVKVALPLVETMRDRLENVANSTGFEGRMVVQEDTRLGPGDCRVEWADGGAERDLSGLLVEMEQIVDHALQSLPVAAGD
jgi:flagellar assembly protein FliH